jgi:hypothetical protein
MSFSEIISGLLPTGRSFASETDIKAFLQGKYSDHSEKYLEAGQLLIFWGPAQKTWLIATNKALYCVFDIKNEKAPRVKWRISKENIGSGLTLSVIERSNQTGYIIIDGKKQRKYSRKLFAQVPIDEAIRAMLSSPLGLTEATIPTEGAETTRIFRTPE